MKNRDLMIAGSFLLAFGLTASAQNEDQLFFYGFEDNLSSFSDSSHPLDSIMTLRYYARENDGNGAKTIDNWVLDPEVYDTALYLLNGVQTCQENDPNVRANDMYEVIKEVDDRHAVKMEKLGAEGGYYYLHFKTSKNVADNTNESGDYQGCVFIRNIPIEDQTSYRLVYYVRTDQPDQAKMYSGIFRGYYNSEKSLSLNGASGNEFQVHKTSGFSNDWQRQTVMAYYQNDSIQNHHTYAAGYWWTNSWKRLSKDGKELVFIQQPDKFFVRLTFSAPSTDYYVDDIALYKSWIGGAESNADIIRINFGYETNLAKLADASSLKAIELPAEYFAVTGVDSFIPNSDGACRALDETDAEFKARLEGDNHPEFYHYDRSDIPVTSAEYHNDGYMYIFLAPDENGYAQECSFFGDIRVSFRNPSDPKMQLVYTGTLYPKWSADSVWIKAGKIVPDFDNEFVLPNSSVAATPVAMLAPTVMKIEPSDGSFKLPTTTTKIKAYFNKPVYVDKGGGASTTTGVKLIVKKSGGAEETWIAQEFDSSDSTVIFQRQATGELKGDYVVTVIQARAGSSYEAHANQSFALAFGPADVAPQVFADSKLDAKDANGANINELESIPVGYAVFDNNTSIRLGTGKKATDNSKTRLYYMSDNGKYNRGLYSSSRGASADKGGRVFYGLDPERPLHLATGTYNLCFSNVAWDGAAETKVYLYKKGDLSVVDVMSYDKANKTVLGTFTPVTTVKHEDIQGHPDYVLSKVDEYKYGFQITEESDYIIEWALENNNWSANLYSGFTITNQYSSAFVYINKVNDAVSKARNMQSTAEANDEYQGSVLASLMLTVAKYDRAGYKFVDDPSKTLPAEYDAVASEISSATLALKVRMDSVDLYNKEYSGAFRLVDTTYANTDTVRMSSYIALKSLVDANKNRVLKTTEPSELRIVIKNIQDGVKSLNDRLATNQRFADVLNDVVNTLDTKKAYDFFAEYPALEAAYNANKGTDVVLSTDAEMEAAISALKSALNAMNGKYDGAMAMAYQTNKLYALAQTLGVDFNSLSEGSLSKLGEIMSKLDNDNSDLKSALKSAIKAKLYKMAAAGDEIPANLDFSGFINNPNLYSAAAIDKEIEKYYYSYGTPNDRWKIKKGTWTTVYPGWTLEVKGGNLHATNETRNWIDASPVFDGWLASDWNSGFSISQELSDLPLGTYVFGVAFNNNQNNAGCNFMVSVLNADTTIIDTVLVKTGSADYIEEPNIFSDEMAVTSGTVKIVANQANVNGWARLDNFTAIFKGALDNGVDYAALATSEEASAKSQLNAVVDGVDNITFDGTVKYYNMSGIEVDANAKGLIIKVTVDGNGNAISSEKIFK